MNTRSIRVLVVDHNTLMRDGLALLVRLQDDLHLAGAAATAGQALDLYLQHRPDVVLLDLDLPAPGALNAILQIRAVDPGARIIGLATYRGDRPWQEALDAGAYCCVAKDDVGDTLPRFIRACAGREHPDH